MHVRYVFNCRLYLSCHENNYVASSTFTHASCETVILELGLCRLGGKRGQTDSGRRTADTKRKFLFMSAFSTLVENADTLENARKTCKNDKIRNFQSCPHFPL
jgi:hypothetical protein